ncbi:MAG TPA: recombinase family protein [Terriglobales bacterium]
MNAPGCPLRGLVERGGTHHLVKRCVPRSFSSTMFERNSKSIKGSERAIIYIRVSTERQLQGASLQTQERDCRALCDRSGWEVLHVFREEGESAKTADRPVLQQLLEYCRVNRPRPDYVVVHHVDRWARNGRDYDDLRLYLLKLDVKLRSYSQRLGEDEYDQFYERMVSGQAELENKLRGRRSLEGMKTRLAAGKWPFRAALGYVNGRDDKGEKVLLLDSQRAPLVRKAFELFASGVHSQRQVRDRMNAEGLRTRSGKPVDRETFSRMLRNPLYAGIVEVDEWGVAETGKHPAIISVELFQRVQDLLEGRRRTVTPRQRNNPDFPLRNFVNCGHCHRPVTASWSKGKMGVKYAYYRCQNRSCSSPLNVSKQVFEHSFVEFIRQHQPNPAYLKLFKEAVLDVWNERQSDAAALSRKLERTVAELKDNKRKLMEAFFYQESMSQDDYNEMRDALMSNLATAEFQLSQARSEEIEIEQVLDFGENLLLNAAGVWQRSSLEQKQRLQQVLFPRGVEFTEGNYRTQETSFLFKSFETIVPGDEIIGGSATGNRTRV